ncbi:MAG TPA: hypothetical protein VK157_17815, partial [Phycisphaerales bacterium]|nr:hypothetical protein [Phycisphaerales bacterium]
MSNRGSNSRKQRPDVVVGVYESAVNAVEMHVVVVRSAGPGQAARVVLAKTVTRSLIAQELGTFKGAVVVRVAPLERTIARLGVVPVASSAEMQTAVNLMAEAEFPANVPAHRIAAAMLPASDANGQTRAALFTAWIGKEAPSALREGVTEQWTTPLGALVALRGKKSGHIVHADKRVGAVAVLLQQDAMQAARVVVDDPTDDVAWEHVAAQCVQELAATSGVELDDTAAAAIANDNDWASRAEWLHGRVTGTLIDQAWLSKYGIALGAAIMLVEDSLGITALCDMTAHAPKVRKPGLVRFGEWISQGSRPIVVGAAALALLVGVPFGLSYARYQSLQSRRDGLESINKSAGDIKLKAAMFKQLETSRAPMTKLLSDIAGAAPVGVEIIETRLAVDQDITIRGKATSADLHRQFVRNLNASKLFAGNVKETRTESKDSVTEFEVSAKLDNPHLPVKAA